MPKMKSAVYEVSVKTCVHAEQRGFHSLKQFVFVVLFFFSLITIIFPIPHQRSNKIRDKSARLIMSDKL